jgi:hypothetical protein
MAGAPDCDTVLTDPVRTCANSAKVTLTDGRHIDRVEVLQPLGHARRRAESFPYLQRKLAR